MEKEEKSRNMEEVIKIAGDKLYRSILNDEETKNTKWRHGGPPIFDAVNNLFEQGRTREWAKGSLEEVVQNAVKSWEMELSHKTCLQDFKTINPLKFKLIVNGMYILSTEKEIEVMTGATNETSSLVKAIQGLLRKDWEVKANHVYREGNRSADWLANLGDELPLGLHLFTNAPVDLYNCMEQDILGVSFPRMCVV